MNKATKMFSGLALFILIFSMFMGLFVSENVNAVSVKDTDIKVAFTPHKTNTTIERYNVDDGVMFGLANITTPYSSDYDINISWGDDSFDEISNFKAYLAAMGVPDLTAKHNYTETGQYTIRLKVTDTTLDRYNYGYETVNVWDRLVTFGVDEYNITEYQDPAISYSNVAGNFLVVSTNCTWNNIMDYFVPYDHTTDTFQSYVLNGTSMIFTYNLKYNEELDFEYAPDDQPPVEDPAYLWHFHEVESYSSIVVINDTINPWADGAIMADAVELTPPKDANHLELKNQFPTWTTKTADFIFTYYHNGPWICSYLDWLFAKTFPALGTFGDGEITTSEYNNMVIKGNQWLNLINPASYVGFEDTEEFFYLDLSFFEFDTDSGRFGDANEALIGPYCGLSGFGSYDALERNVTTDLVYDLDASGLIDEGDRHIARWYLVTSSDITNYSVSLEVKTAYEITDFDAFFYADVYRNPEKTYIRYDLWNVPTAMQPRAEWVDVVIDTRSTPTPTPDDDDEGGADEVPSKEKDDRNVLEKMWDWWVDKWDRFWGFIITYIVILIILVIVGLIFYWAYATGRLEWDW